MRASVESQLLSMVATERAASGTARPWRGFFALADRTAVWVAITATAVALPTRAQTARTFAEASSVAAIDRLPTDTRTLVVRGVGAEALPALRRLRDLEHLTMIGAPLNAARGADSPQTTSLTDDAFAQLAHLSKLRRLELDTHPALTGAGLGALERLPVLESLALRSLELSAASLAGLAWLPSLEQLDLTRDSRIGATELAAIARCRGLRRLSLRGCHRVRGEVVDVLADLPRLEVLDLGDDDGVWHGAGKSAARVPERRLEGFVWRTGRRDVSGSTFGDRSAVIGELLADNDASRNAARWRVEGARARRDLAGRQAAPPPDDGTLDRLAALPALRELCLPADASLATGRGELRRARSLVVLALEAGGLDADAVADLPRALRVLVVGGDVGDDACARLRASLPQLTRLELVDDAALTARGIAEIAKTPSLRHVALRRCAALDLGGIELFLRAEQLQVVDVRDNEHLHLEHLDVRRRSSPGLQLLSGASPRTGPSAFPWRSEAPQAQR